MPLEAMMLGLHKSREVEAKPLSVKHFFSLVRLKTLENVLDNPLVFPNILLHEEAKWNHFETIVVAITVVRKPNFYCILPFSKL